MHKCSLINTHRSLSPGHAKALYERGAALLQLGKQTGIVDVNKALAIDPTLWLVCCG